MMAFPTNLTTFVPILDTGANLDGEAKLNEIER